MAVMQEKKPEEVLAGTQEEKAALLTMNDTTWP